MSAEDGTRSDRSPNPVDVYVGRRLRAAREALGENDQTAAASLDMDLLTYMETESGLRRASPATLYKCASLFRRHISWFFEGLPMPECTEVFATSAIVGFGLTDCDRNQS